VRGIGPTDRPIARAASALRSTVAGREAKTSRAVAGYRRRPLLGEASPRAMRQPDRRESRRRGSRTRLGALIASCTDLVAADSCEPGRPSAAGVRCASRPPGGGPGKSAASSSATSTSSQDSYFIVPFQHTSLRHDSPRPSGSRHDVTPSERSTLAPAREVTIGVPEAVDNAVVRRARSGRSRRAGLRFVRPLACGIRARSRK